MAALRTCIVLVSALAWAACPLTAARAATVNASVSAKVVKPLKLTSRQNLDFGQIVLGAGAGSWTVAISAAGALSCPAPLLCTGAFRPAVLNVTGSSGTVVVTTMPTDLVNGTGDRLRFTPVAPASVRLTNNGNKGEDFNVGGSITLSSATPDGAYSGVVQVTVDYQ